MENPKICHYIKSQNSWKYLIKNYENIIPSQLLGSAQTGSALLQLSRHHILDTVCLAAMQLNWATPEFVPTQSLQMALFSDTIFIVSGVGGDGNHCHSKRQVVLSSPTLINCRVCWSSCLQPSFFPPSYTHLLGGKAWISPFPLSLTLKCSLSPSHLVPLLSFPLLPSNHYVLLFE